MKIEKKVLLIDANSALIDRLACLLDDGYLLERSSNGIQALEMVRKFRPGIIVMDLDLPDVSAQELFLRFRQFYRQSPVQIVLMSSAVKSENLSGILSEGADDFIRKPFEDFEFQLRVKAAYIRYLAQQSIYEEREFYRLAVRKEEDLSEMLLDRQIDLKESLADLEDQKSGLELENTKLEVIARFDVLTGLLNRHSLDARLDLEMRRTRKEGVPLAGMMADIDRFKAVNDTYGHLLGDDVLRALGDALKKCLRKEDYAGRYGGDEFFVILPGSNLNTAMMVAERIRVACAAVIVEVPGAKLGVTISIGIAMCKKEDSVTDWIEKTDVAMYEIKKAGGNREGA
jgi:two-component system, chemotaxis family, response regulator WspR